MVSWNERTKKRDAGLIDWAKVVVVWLIIMVLATLSHHVMSGEMAEAGGTVPLPISATGWYATPVTPPPAPTVADEYVHRVYIVEVRR